MILSISPYGSGLDVMLVDLDVVQDLSRDEDVEHLVIEFSPGHSCSQDF